MIRLNFKKVQNKFIFLLTIVMGCLITMVQKPLSSCFGRKSNKNNNQVVTHNTSQISSDSSILNSSLTYFKSNSISDFNKEVSTADLLSLENNDHINFFQDEIVWKVSSFVYFKFILFLKEFKKLKEKIVSTREY
jgi:hypothetical protein